MENKTITIAEILAKPRNRQQVNVYSNTISYTTQLYKVHIHTLSFHTQYYFLYKITPLIV